MPDAIEALREGRHAEQLGVLGRALEAYETAARSSPDPDVVVEALVRQADVLRAQCWWDDALDRARRAQEMAAAHGLAARRAEALNAEALVFMTRGDFDAALPLIEQVAASATEPRLRGIALQNLGTIRAQQGQLGAAAHAFGESYGCFLQAGYERGQAIALNNQGRVALDRGDAAMAESVLEEAVRAARAVEDAELVALSMANYAEAILARGDAVRAESLACSALGHFRASSNTWRTVECLRLLGTIHQHRGNVGEAGRCYERALTLAREIGAQVEIKALEGCLHRLARFGRH